MSVFARATIAVFLCVNAACLDGAPGNTRQTTDQSITGTTVLPATGWGELGQPAPTILADGSVSWCCTTWFTPLSLAVGDVIGSLSVPVRDNGAANGFSVGGNNVLVVLTAQTASGPVNLGNVSSNGSGNPQTLPLTLATPYTVPQGVSLVVRAIAMTGGANPGPALHPSTIGGIQVIPPSSSPSPLALVYVTIPSRLFAAADTNGMQIYPVAIADGSKFYGASIAAQCPLLGWISACARIREIGTWDWCSAPVSCIASASAVIPIPAGTTATADRHIDLGLLSGPSLATAPFGVIAVQ